MMESGMPLREPSTSDDELGRLERVLVQSGTRIGELQAELRRMGTSDALTRLMNRRGFLPTAEHQLKVAKRTHQPLALMFLDLDGLKRVNDTLGHATGDRHDHRGSVRAPGDVPLLGPHRSDGR